MFFFTLWEPTSIFLVYAYHKKNGEEKKKTKKKEKRREEEKKKKYMNSPKGIRKA